jgi:hypothetical protein
MSLIGIGGSGIALPYPANNYGYAPVGGTNKLALPAGGTWLVPSGTWIITTGQYTFLQALDPVTNTWFILAPDATFDTINSDGANYRLANLTGTMIGAIVTNVGSAYTSAPVVTASAGGSTWTAIVGGAISQTVTIGTAGSNYTLAPTVLISAPPVGGVQATAYATLTAGAVSSITVVDQGAGYTAAPTITLVTNPSDPNIASTLSPITVAKATCTLTGANTVTAVLCTYQGTPLTALPTLAFSGGGGSAAAATAIGVFTTTAAALTGTAGAAYNPSAPYYGTALGGYTTAAAGAVVNPSIGTKAFTPRPANFGVVTSTAGSAIANATFPINDGGLYQNASAVSTLVGPPNLTLVTTGVTFTTTFGGVSDISFITPMG